ncbi:winged helix-turn-helix domain-containing protein [Schaalia georgiae]|nr:winged helix-turn-helix domain-containing protein [Schaalia georgiae]
MRKKDLHSLRKANRRLVLGLLAEGAPLSRAEIAERTALSASTVSTIMSDLLTEGLVHDTGDTESTGGRGRRLLDINPACGVMAIAEIQRQRTTVSFHDMGLGRLGARTLEVPIKPGAGDRLLQAICECVSAFAHCAPAPGGLAGIGLLFDDQAIASDVTVLYSTGFDEASISLRQALITRFKVPVVEESAQACSARELVAAHLDNARSWAHIALGPRITLSLTTEEGPAPIGSRGSADLTEAVMPGQAHPERVLAALARSPLPPRLPPAPHPDWPTAPEGEAAGRATPPPSAQRPAEQARANEAGTAPVPARPSWPHFLGRLSDTITTVVSLVPLDALLVSGEIASTTGFTALLARTLALRLRGRAPRVIPLTHAAPAAPARMATGLRATVLTS